MTRERGHDVCGTGRSYEKAIALDVFLRIRKKRLSQDSHLTVEIRITYQPKLIDISIRAVLDELVRLSSDRDFWIVVQSFLGLLIFFDRFDDLGSFGLRKGRLLRVDDFPRTVEDSHCVADFPFRGADEDFCADMSVS